MAESGVQIPPCGVGMLTGPEQVHVDIPGRLGARVAELLRYRVWGVAIGGPMSRMTVAIGLSRRDLRL
jgi:hypothetical protein